MTDTIRCVILDDEILALSYLKLLCEQIDGVEVIKAFNRPEVFLEEINTLDCSVCILDIEMPGTTGLQVAAKIPDKQIIFTTAYKEYAADAYDLNVVDYVRKPLKKERLEQAFAKVKKTEKRPETHFFEWNTGRGKTTIAAKAVLYIKTSDIDSRDKIVLLDDDSEIVLKNINFRNLIDLLPKESVIQINKKEAVALKSIKAFSGSEIVTAVAKSKLMPLKLHLSETFRDGFQKAMNKEIGVSLHK